MLKNILFVFGLGLMMGAQAQAATALPETLAGFDKMSIADVKALPDYKWELGKSVTAADTKGKSATELMLLRNSIYAQHGVVFSQPNLQAYFASRSWFKATHQENAGGYMAVTEKESGAAHDLMRAQGLQTNHRDVAQDDDGTQTIEQVVSWGVYEMGFCTYANQYSQKAGMIVFEGGGVAHVFHSEGSMGNIDPYSADQSATQGKPSRMITGNWYIKPYGKNQAQVFVNLDAAAIASAMGGTGGEDSPVVAPGPRLVIDTKNNYFDTKMNYMNKRDCTMLIQKAQK